MAEEQGVGRKFVYKQKLKAMSGIDQAFDKNALKSASYSAEIISNFDGHKNSTYFVGSFLKKNYKKCGFSFILNKFK